jgi:TPR repeat protein
MEIKNPIPLNVICSLLIATWIVCGCSEEKKPEKTPDATTNKPASAETQERVRRARSIDPAPPEKPAAPDPRKAVADFRQRLQTITGKTYPTADELKVKAEAGDAASQVDYARKLASEGNREEALKWYQKAAEQGNTDGQHAVGIAYVTGDQGVKQDYAEAIKWFTKAADQGFMDSQYALGLRYARGDGVAQDFAQAAKWFGLAANQGSVYAQAGLALRYERGDGVSMDKVEAYKWYDIADHNGHFSAGHSRDKLAEGMTPDQIKDAQNRSSAFKPVLTKR